MSGPFSSINTALSALRYNQVVLDTASNNIANVTTDGYTRRTVNADSVGASNQTAMWSRSAGTGDGVRVSGVDRMVNHLLDSRARTEHGRQSYLDLRQVVLDRVEAGVGEPGGNGVAAALSAFRQSWSDLANNPGGTAARSQVLANANTVADALRLQARNIATESDGLRSQAQSTVTEVNTVAGDLASVNDAISVAQLNGTDAGGLLDRRDQLTMRLSELTGAIATSRSDGGVDVALNGVALVTGKTADRLEISSGITGSGTSDGNPLTFAIVSTSGTTTVPAGMTGEIGAIAELLDTTLPAHTQGLNVVAKQLADAVNALHQSGYDLAGNAGLAFFGYDPADAAATLTVAITDPARIAASALPGGVLEAGIADQLGATTGAENTYQSLISGFGSQVASAKRLATNQRALTTQVDASRDQLAGVSIDEETLTLMTAQRAYEAASRVMSVMDSVLDTLINRTGLVR